MKVLGLLVVVLGLACLAPVAFGQEIFKPLAGSGAYPGYLFYYWERPTAHRIEMKVVGEGVNRALGLELSFPKVEGAPGVIFRETGHKDGTDFSGFEGFSFWMRGDGSDGKGVVILGYSVGPTATFPLAEKNWHRVDLKWSDFQPAPEAKNIGQLAFSLAADSKRPASYVIDRPGFARKFAELGEADRKAGVKGQVAARPLRERGPDFSQYVSNAESLAKTRAKLAAKEPVKIVAWGDSITMGSQLWSVGDEKAVAAAVYHGVFAAKLKQRFGYDGITVVNSSKGGYQTHQALPNIQAEVLDHKPDMVIMAVAGGDTVYSTLESFKTNWTKIIETLTGAGIEVICWAPTPAQFAEQQGDPFADYIRGYAREHKLAVADQRACFMARGGETLGELIPDDVHPNPRGHELMAEVLLALFPAR